MGFDQKNEVLMENLTPWKVVRSTFQTLVSLYNLLVEEGFFHPILSIFVFSFTGNQLGAVLAVLG